ncbi:androgen dependent TFPI regulating protein 1 isoform X5 [Electrophorus electricus]|uniref:androgen dependent TFPI regulating protein 1 isoform X5 n=1 Tax=Electrophorus electricus TaxID=8005 RepID=UPI000F09F30A|nr:androgen dependent TFPI regulating protein 1 isoform X5 [Electrophorus electricus]
MAQTVRPGVNLKLCLLVHITVFAWYVFILYSNCSLDISGRHPGARTYGGRWKYLTFINLVMQTGFFAVCVITDVAHLVVPSRSTRGTVLFLVSARDGLFTVLAAPVGTFVCASFWSLYAYDRELVYPKLIDHIIPVWLNHALGLMGSPHFGDLGVPHHGPPQSARLGSVSGHRLCQHGPHLPARGEAQSCSLEHSRGSEVKEIRDCRNPD